MPPAVLPPVPSAESRVTPRRSTARLPAHGASKTSTPLLTSRGLTEPGSSRDDVSAPTVCPRVKLTRAKSGQKYRECLCTFDHPAGASSCLRRCSCDSDKVAQLGCFGSSVKNEAISCPRKRPVQNRQGWRAYEAARLLDSGLYKTIHFNQSSGHAALVADNFLLTEMTSSSIHQQTSPKPKKNKKATRFEEKNTFCILSRNQYSPHASPSLPLLVRDISPPLSVKLLHVFRRHPLLALMPDVW